MIQKQGNWMPYELKPRERRFFTCEQLIRRQQRKGFLRIVTEEKDILRQEEKILR